MKITVLKLVKVHVAMYSYAAPGKLNLSKLSPKEMDIPLPVIGM